MSRSEPMLPPPVEATLPSDRRPSSELRDSPDATDKVPRLGRRIGIHASPGWKLPAPTAGTIVVVSSSLSASSWSMSISSSESSVEVLVGHRLETNLSPISFVLLACCRGESSVSPPRLRQRGELSTAVTMRAGIADARICLLNGFTCACGCVGTCVVPAARARAQELLIDAPLAAVDDLCKAACATPASRSGSLVGRAAPQAPKMALRGSGRERGLKATADAGRSRCNRLDVVSTRRRLPRRGRRVVAVLGLTRPAVVSTARSGLVLRRVGFCRSLHRRAWSAARDTGRLYTKAWVSLSTSVRRHKHGTHPVASNDVASLLEAVRGRAKLRCSVERGALFAACGCCCCVTPLFVMSSGTGSASCSRTVRRFMAYALNLTQTAGNDDRVVGVQYGHRKSSCMLPRTQRLLVHGRGESRQIITFLTFIVSLP